MIEDDKNFYLEVELPGLTDKDIQLDITDRHLVIKGEKKNKQLIDNANLYRVERRYGQFERRFLLPDHVDTDNIKANFESGILKIGIPKGQDRSTRSIEINKQRIAS